MGDVLGLLEFAAAGFPQVFADFRFQLRELPPGLEDLAVVAEGGDAGGYNVVVARLGHQGELARHDGHGRLLRDGVAVIGDAGAGGVVLGFEDVTPEQVPADGEEILLAGREEILPDAAPDIEIMVVRYFLLVVRPDFLFSLVDHSLLKCPGEQCSKVYFVYSSKSMPISAAFSREAFSTAWMRSVPPVTSKMA